MSKNSDGISDDLTREVNIENTAQGVLNRLKELVSNREHMRTRWVGELLQNARDTSAGDDTLIASIKHKEGEVVFRHNGHGFTKKEMAHLIYHGSTKVEDRKTIGQYGTGFLTTHLLSPTIDVSGRLNDDRSFKFSLKREVGSVEELRESMDQARDDFNNSLFVESTPNNFDTQFRYPIRGKGAANAVRDGLATLKRCAPFVVVFNKAFSCIEIKSPDETINFSVTNRQQLQEDGLQETTVAEAENGTQKDRKYLLAQGEKALVAVPLESMGDGWTCLPLDGTPRLFLGFPLVGTEKFSFPAIINSFQFTPTENRDGVFLWQNNNDEDEANCKNQAVIEEACALLIRLLQFAASSDYYNTFALANVPTIREQSWLDPERLRGLLKEQLIERIRQTPAVLCEHGAIVPQDSILPFAEKEAGVETLWDLLDGLKKFRQKLPRRNEAVGWSKAIRSWAALRGCQPTSFDEAFDGRKLAERVGEECGSLENLQELLREEVCAVKWLDRLYQFLKDDKLFDETRSLCIFPAQAGNLDELSNLHRDQDIAEELKDIAELLGWDIRRELRDKRLPSLTNEGGAGDWDSGYVVQHLIAKLQKYADEKPDDKFAEASVHLFTWIVGQKNWDRLRGFPVFAKEGDSDNRRAFRLDLSEEDDNRPLAPIRAWPENLQPYSDLFPWRYILADDFFEASPDPDIWQTLDEKGFLKRGVIITKNVYFKTFLPNEPLSEESDHETADKIAVTNVAFLTTPDIGAIDRVRGSQRLARIFWCFLTEWLVVNDSEGLEIKEARCDCDETHRYYRAEWLEPLVKRTWVPREGGRRDRATAQSLASLLRDSEWAPSSLNENPAAVKLLEVIGVTRFDLTREFVAENPETRTELDNTFTDILVATGGDVSHLNHIHDFVQDLKDDEALPGILQKRREDREIVQKNQHLGKCVEELVKESLEDEGFAVTRTGIGSDYEIELSSGDQSWLVEVKSTQGQEVRMTDTQARKAVEKEDGFLLCVVPVESETPALDEVRDKMRFVENIGSLVEPLCNGLDEFEDLRDEITDDKSSGVQLVVEAGTARVRVASSVWQDDSFPLAELSNRLQ